MDKYQELIELLAGSADRDNPGPDELKKIMESVRTIAVVGISRNPEKPARRVPAYLASKGYDIIPVNPYVDEILGKKAKESLADVTDPVDMVLIFRPSEEAAKVSEAAMRREERPVIWLQKEIQDDQMAAIARGLGFTVVQDLCTYEVHRTLNPS